MTFIRSLLFNAFFYGWLTFLLLTYWIFLPFPRPVMRRALTIWSRIAISGMRVLGGMPSRFEGLENLPDGAAVIASKHQSTWETFALFDVLSDPCYILKKELTHIPFFGWYARKAEHIAVDRSGGAKALRDMAAACREKLAEGRQVIIFPEGTRVTPGSSRRYHPGIMAIYADLPDGVPVVPAALNSGVHWGRQRFGIVPGPVTIRFLPPIEGGMNRKDFMAKLEAEIESASKALLAPPKG